MDIITINWFAIGSKQAADVMIYSVGDIATHTMTKGLNAVVSKYALVGFVSTGTLSKQKCNNSCEWFIKVIY